MGAGASRRMNAGEAAVSSLPPSFSQGADTCFHCLTRQPELMKNNSHVVLEVGQHGFRLLKTQPLIPLHVFSWGQIHSWSHADNDFSFRYFDDASNTIQRFDLSLRDIDQLLDKIGSVVESILDDRKAHAIADALYQALLAKVRSSEQQSSNGVQAIAQAAREHYFTTDQGREMMALLPNLFDRIEVAVTLHSRLVDQSRFADMLTILEDPVDRDNVWCRVMSN